MQVANDVKEFREFNFCGFKFTLYKLEDETVAIDTDTSVNLNKLSSMLLSEDCDPAFEQQANFGLAELEKVFLTGKLHPNP